MDLGPGPGPATQLARDVVREVLEAVYLEHLVRRRHLADSGSTSCAGLSLTCPSILAVRGLGHHVAQSLMFSPDGPVNPVGILFLPSPAH